MRKQVNLWTQKDKTRIRICDMSDKHLVSCINVLRQFGKAELQEITHNLLAVGARIRGEIAEGELERSLDELAEKHWNDFVPDVFWNMIKDVRRRALLRPGIIDNLIGIPNWIVR